jgi:hypothetical protein
VWGATCNFGFWGASVSEPVSNRMMTAEVILTIHNRKKCQNNDKETRYQTYYKPLLQAHEIFTQ